MISGESRALLDLFYLWKLSPQERLLDLPAKTVEGFLILEAELRKEGHADAFD